MYRQNELDIYKLQQGSKNEFNKVYIDFFDSMFALCYQYTKNIAVAEELVQDTFLTLWEIRTSLNINSNIKNFLYTMAKNNCLNYLRNQQIRFKFQNKLAAKELYYREISLQSVGNSVYEFEELKTRIGEAVEKLPAELRLVFEMNRNQGLKYTEISHKLEISVKTVEARISKALKLLKQDLKDYFPLIFIF